MAENNHEKRIRDIETECAEIKRQMLKFEFQHKKDIANLQKESEQRWKRIEKQNEYVEKHLRHLSKLAGISFEKLDEIDERLESASAALTPRKKRSKRP